MSGVYMSLTMSSSAAVFNSIRASEHRQTKASTPRPWQLDSHLSV